MRKFLSLLMATFFSVGMFAVTYTVAGNSDVLFGTTWDPSNQANDMTLASGTTYEFVREGVTLGAGVIKFKVCEDHAWTKAYPSSDYEWTIASSGVFDIKISFDASNNEISTVADKKGDAVVIPSIAMHGNFTGSWSDTENFTKAADEKSASLKLTLAAKTFEFGMRIGGSGNWTSNGAQFTRESNSAVVTDGSGNMKLVADAAGEYTFTWTYETNTLSIVFPEKGEGGDVDPEPEDVTYLLFGSDPAIGAWEGAGAVEMVDGKATVTLQAGDCQFKVVPNDWNWEKALGFAQVDAECSSKGVVEGTDNNNIKVTLAEAGDMTVEVKEGKLCVTGNFVTGEQPGEDVVYLLFGSDPAIGAWEGAGAVEMVDGKVTVTLQAGDCEFKAVPSDWNWDNALGFAQVDAECSSEGISEGDNGNVKITMAEAGDMTVEVKNGKLCVTGNFVTGGAPTLADGFYLIGKTGWNVAALSANLLFVANEGADGEYKLDVNLAVNDPIKVVLVENDAIKTWYPDGEGNEFVVDDAHAGDKTIYFRPEKGEGWTLLEGYIYIEENPISAISNAVNDVKAMKFIENGQLFIIANGIVYTIMGQIR